MAVVAVAMVLLALAAPLELVVRQADSVDRL